MIACALPPQHRCLSCPAVGHRARIAGCCPTARMLPPCTQSLNRCQNRTMHRASLPLPEFDHRRRIGLVRKRMRARRVHHAALPTLVRKVARNASTNSPILQGTTKSAE